MATKYISKGDLPKKDDMNAPKFIYGDEILPKLSKNFLKKMPLIFYPLK